MDSTNNTLPPEQSPLGLTDINTKKKIFHLTSSILVVIFSVIQAVYHIIVGIVWMAYSIFGYGMADALMFFLNFFTLAIGITGILAVIHDNMNVAYRYTLLKFNVASSMMGLSFLAFTFFFVSLTEFSYANTNVYAYSNGSMTPATNFTHASIALVWALVYCLLSICSSISGFMYYQFFDEFRLEKAKQQLIQSQHQTTTSVIVQQ